MSGLHFHTPGLPTRGHYGRVARDGRVARASRYESASKLLAATEDEVADTTYTQEWKARWELQSV